MISRGKADSRRAHKKMRPWLLEGTSVHEALNFVNLTGLESTGLDVGSGDGAGGADAPSRPEAAVRTGRNDRSRGGYDGRRDGALASASGAEYNRRSLEDRTAIGLG
jgi:hypothetical protein